MKFTPMLRRLTEKFLKQLDPGSLRVRLTVGIATVSAIGLGSVAVWIGWRMQRILVSTHRDNIEHIAERLPHDIEIYDEMLDSREQALQKAVNNLTKENVFLWIRNPRGDLVAYSYIIDNPNTVLASLMDAFSESEGVNLATVDGRFWVLCWQPLQIDGELIGHYFVAEDITEDQVLYSRLIRNLGIGSLIAISGMTVASAFYIKCSLYPLHCMGQLTEKISAESLTEAKLQLDNAPSEVKELAQTFDDMLMRLSQSWEQQRQFVSNVSHELRTPLTIVSGYLQSTLRRGSNLSEPQREALTIAAAEAERTIQLMQDLLTLARADSGYMHFQLEMVELHGFLEKIIEVARHYSNRDIRLDTNCGFVKVKADINRLKQVILNLIDNAVKYSEADQPITIGLSKQGELARIQVCDRGVGIPLKHQNRIFERFYRVDETRTRSTGGTGLGLSIVKTLVEGMGGQISLTSKLGEGSTFTVSLPACS